MLMLTEFGVKTVQSLTYFWKIQNDKKKLSRISPIQNLSSPTRTLTVDLNLPELVLWSPLLEHLQ